ncbi:hypothetical protein Leryth_024558 [Lithospermum erythrorhizon]|nr:hypothetical protein Leryth_024558 [Lithospermum erythrorhizon]
MALRVYQLWKGRNIFLLKGRLVFGPDAKSILITLLLIIVPVFIFVTFIGRKFVDKVNAGYAISPLIIVFTIFVLFLLFMTSASDPGFVPRNSSPPDEVLVSDLSVFNDTGERNTQGTKLPRIKQVFVNRLPVKVKYCETCMLFRSPRCSHCSVCDNCVEKFDHHCPFVGQCIGRRNYRCFFLFISASAILCISVFSLSAFYMKLVVDDYASIWEAVKNSPAPLIVMVYCFLLLWFVGGLTGFHLYLMSTNQTTYEFFRCRANTRINVYDQGCMENLSEVFCRKIEPSKINFREYVQEASRNCRISIQQREAHFMNEDKREKVEDDREIGNDLWKISQRRDSKEIDDVRISRGSDGFPRSSGGFSRSPSEFCFGGFGMEA